MPNTLPLESGRTLAMPPQEPVGISTPHIRCKLALRAQPDRAERWAREWSARTTSEHLGISRPGDYGGYKPISVVHEAKDVQDMSIWPPAVRV